jgi:hypothetical protein
MRSAARNIVRWIRRRAFVVALAAAGLLAASAVAWFTVDLTRAPDFAAHGHQPYLAAQQRLHVQEARA